MEELLFHCPHCGASLTPPPDGWSMTCPNCSHRVDLTGQFAFARAIQAYDEASEVLDELNDSKRIKKIYYMVRLREKEAINLYAEAHSALQVAFRYELTDDQHAHAVKMMIDICQMFLPRNMISGMEAGYWRKLMIEQNSHEEFLDLGRKLTDGQGKKGGFLLRFRWRQRRNQLARELIKLDRQIREIENGMQLAFNYHPYRGRKN